MAEEVSIWRFKIIFTIVDNRYRTYLNTYASSRTDYINAITVPVSSQNILVYNLRQTIPKLMSISLFCVMQYFTCREKLWTWKLQNCYRHTWHELLWGQVIWFHFVLCLFIFAYIFSHVYCSVPGLNRTPVYILTFLFGHTVWIYCLNQMNQIRCVMKWVDFFTVFFNVFLRTFK